MAKARMLHNKISKSLQVDSMPLPAQLLFTWMISWGDDEGRLKGEVKYIKGTVVPYKNWSDKLVQQYLEQMRDNGLIHYWQENNEWFIEFVKWDDYQHIRKDRFEPSKLPSFNLQNDNHMSPNRQPNNRHSSTQYNEMESSQIESSIEDRDNIYSDIDSIKEEDIVEISKRFGISKEDVEKQLDRLGGYAATTGEQIKDYKAMLYKFVQTEIERKEKSTARN